MPLGLVLIAIAVGWYLLSRGAQPTPAQPVIPIQPRYHIVKRDDWMSKIGATYGLSLEQLIALNPPFRKGGGRNIDLLEVGEKIRIS